MKRAGSGAARRQPFLIVASCLAAILLATPALAAETEVHGFLLGVAAGRTSTRPHPATGANALTSEGRLRLDLEAWDEAGESSARVRAELRHDALVEQDSVELREAWADTPARGGAARVGRQIHTWGVGDLLFVADVFPKDWHAWFAGYPVEYLKRGVDGVSWSGPAGPVELDLVLAPRFRPDLGPDPARFEPWDPFAGPSGSPPRSGSTPPADLTDPWAAARLARDFGAWRLALVASRTRWGLAAQRPSGTSVLENWPRLNVYALTASGPVGSGVLGFEAGWYESREDDRGSDPFTPNGQARVLLSWQQQVGEDSTITLQAYAEIRARQRAYERALPAGMEPMDRARPLAMARLTRFFAHQTWRIDGIVFADPQAGDGLAGLDLVRSLGDSVQLGLSARVFEGPRDTPFGAMDRDDNVAVWLKFSF